MIRVALIGAAGRMGEAISRAAENQPDVQIAARIEIGDALEDSLGDCDVVIDFSHAEATERNCAAASRAGKPLVIGTTGQSPEQSNVIAEAAGKIPLILASNFSVGVNALFWLTRKASQLLGDDCDLEIVETHHRLKKDAPSGTAKRLAQILCQERGSKYETDVAHGREGLVGERLAKQIGMHAIRAGDVVGDHTVIFAAPGERLELTHKASSRETFAVGALRAARWIIGRPAGLYDMEDVLGLSEPTS
jgi:4-hydroxy-tetrahydrodipicolinate reductase